MDEIVSKSTSKDEMMMFGLSYWHVDRNELDEILLSLDNKMEVRFVNPEERLMARLVPYRIIPDHLRLKQMYRTACRGCL